MDNAPKPALAPRPAGARKIAPWIIAAALGCGAIEARAKVGLKMNVPESKLADVTRNLPAEKSPTISRLSDSDWVAVEVILEDKQERELIPLLKRAGATGIITYPLNKVIP